MKESFWVKEKRGNCLLSPNPPFFFRFLCFSFECSLSFPFREASGRPPARPPSRLSNPRTHRKEQPKKERKKRVKEAGAKDHESREPLNLALYTRYLSLIFLAPHVLPGYGLLFSVLAFFVPPDPSTPRAPPRVCVHFSVLFL